MSTTKIMPVKQPEAVKGCTKVTVACFLQHATINDHKWDRGHRCHALGAE